LEHVLQLGMDKEAVQPSKKRKEENPQFTKPGEFNFDQLEPHAIFGSGPNAVAIDQAILTLKTNMNDLSNAVMKTYEIEKLTYGSSLAWSVPSGNEKWMARLQDIYGFEQYITNSTLKMVPPVVMWSTFRKLVVGFQSVSDKTIRSEADATIGALDNFARISGFLVDEGGYFYSA